MMKRLVITLFLFCFYAATYSQSFLNAYEKYRLGKASTITSSETRKKIKRYIKTHITELDTIFKSYRAQTDFDFNYADTLFLIYESPAESPFTGDVIIWTNKDTISYTQNFERVEPFKYKRIIKYTPFVYPVEKIQGFKTVTDRDSLITLVAKRDFNTINHLGDNHDIHDGSFVNIYVAYKVKGRYVIESCSAKKFDIRTSYQKE